MGLLTSEYPAIQKLIDTVAHVTKDYDAKIEQYRAEIAWRQSQGAQKAGSAPPPQAVMPSRKVSREEFDEIRAAYYRDMLSKLGLVIFGLAVSATALLQKDPMLTVSGAAIVASPKLFYA